MRKYLIALMAFVVVLADLSAQDITYKSSGEIYKNSKKGDEIKSIVKTDGGYMSLYTAVVIHPREWEEYEKLTDISILDDKMNVISKREVNNGQKNMNSVGLINTSGKIYFAYTITNKKSLALHIDELHPKTAAVVKSQSTLFDFNNNGKIYDDVLLKMLTSEDSSKHIIFLEHWAKGKQPQILEYIVFDRNMNKLYDKRYEFPYKGKEMRFRNFVAGNDGSLNALYYYYPGGNNTAEKGDGETPPYELRLVNLTSEGGSNVPLSTKGNYLDCVTFIQAPGGKYCIGGIYRPNFKTKPTGAFLYKFDKPEKDLQATLTPFPAEVSENIHPHADFGYFYYGGGEETIKQRAEFPIKMIATDKNVYMLNQYHHSPKFQVTAGNNFKYYIGPILLSVFPNEGATKFNIFSIPVADFKIYNKSDNLFFYKDDLYFFAGSVDEKKKKEDVYAIIKFDKDGNLTGKQDIFKFRDIGEDHAANRSFKKVSNTDFFLEVSGEGSNKFYRFRIQ